MRAGRQKGDRAGATANRERRRAGMQPLQPRRVVVSRPYGLGTSHDATRARASANVRRGSGLRACRSPHPLLAFLQSGVIMQGDLCEREEGRRRGQVVCNLLDKDPARSVVCDTTLRA